VDADRVQHGGEERGVSGVPAGEHQPQWPAVAVGGEVDLAGHTAAGAADRVIRRLWIAAAMTRIRAIRAMLCHMELAGGSEALAETVAALPRAEMERLLRLAVVEIVELQHDVDQDVSRVARRLQERQRTLDLMRAGT
jgi:hypothetical protein